MKLYRGLTLDEDGARLRSAGGLCCPVLRLEELRVDDLELVRRRVRRRGHENHERAVYRHAADRLFFKLWPVDYVRRENLLRGLAAGFFDRASIPALEAIVLDRENRCRGYVTREGKVLEKVPFEVFRHLLERTIASRWCFDDLSSCVISIEGRYSLIDLESVRHLAHISSLTRRRKAHPRPYNLLLRNLRSLLRWNRLAPWRSVDVDEVLSRWPELVDSIDCLEPRGASGEGKRPEPEIP